MKHTTVTTARRRMSRETHGLLKLRTVTDITSQESVKGSQTYIHILHYTIKCSVTNDLHTYIIILRYTIKCSVTNDLHTYIALHKYMLCNIWPTYIYYTTQANALQYMTYIQILHYQRTCSITHNMHTLSIKRTCSITHDANSTKHNSPNEQRNAESVPVSPC